MVLVVLVVLVLMARAGGVLGAVLSLEDDGALVRRRNWHLGSNRDN